MLAASHVYPTTSIRIDIFDVALTSQCRNPDICRADCDSEVEGGECGTAGRTPLKSSTGVLHQEPLRITEHHPSLRQPQAPRYGTSYRFFKGLQWRKFVSLLKIVAACDALG